MACNVHVVVNALLVQCFRPRRHENQQFIYFVRRRKNRREFLAILPFQYRRLLPSYTCTAANPSNCTHTQHRRPRMQIFPQSSFLFSPLGRIKFFHRFQRCVVSSTNFDTWQTTAQLFIFSRSQYLRQYHALGRNFFFFGAHFHFHISANGKKHMRAPNIRQYGIIVSSFAGILL